LSWTDRGEPANIGWNEASVTVTGGTAALVLEGFPPPLLEVIRAAAEVQKTVRMRRLVANFVSLGVPSHCQRWVSEHA
jgi:hypothetical protein